jgi:hypothetical protein
LIPKKPTHNGGGDENNYMHQAFPASKAINRLPVYNRGATNAQSVSMLKLQNLLDPSHGSSSAIMQNPIAQFLPSSFSSGAGTSFSFAL